MKFKLNSAMIRHAGNPGHTIARDGMTEYELRLLRRIHGSDAVFDVRETGEVEREERQEYLLLARYYGVEIVEKTFMVVLDEFADWVEAKMDGATAAGPELPEAPATAPEAPEAPEESTTTTSGTVQTAAPTALE